MIKTDIFVSGEISLQLSTLLRFNGCTHNAHNPTESSGRSMQDQASQIRSRWDGPKPGKLTRRSFAALSAAAIWGATRNAGHAEPDVEPGVSEWALFRERFVTASGRIVDTGNNNASHSEGQGWGLLMAEAHDDQATFDRVLTWTQRELRRSSDALHAWRFMPNRPRAVEDNNNAADGDIFIAWALARAARRWKRPELWEASSVICADLARLCTRELDGRTLLLPASFGFEHRDHIVVNPSYYVFPAFPDLAAVGGPDSPWMGLYRDGLSLMREARFGRWGLPADWLRLSRQGGRPAPAPGWSPRFSYDAVRVPLYLAWAGLATEPAARAAVSFFSGENLPYRPAWTEFAGDRLANYPMNSGQRAVALLAAHTSAGPLPLPSVREAQDYYGAALTLLSHLALAERLPLVA
jgi:endoglucanase